MSKFIPGHSEQLLLPAPSLTPVRLLAPEDESEIYDLMPLDPYELLKLLQPGDYRQMEQRRPMPVNDDLTPSDVMKQLVRHEITAKIRKRQLTSSDASQRETAEDRPSGSKSVEVSATTRQLQQLRREKNRKAAAICRKRRRFREESQTKKLTQLQAEVQRLTDRAQKFEQLYRDSLTALPSQSDFQKYLKKRPHLVRDPVVKPVLRLFVTEDYPKLPPVLMMALVPVTTA